MARAEDLADVLPISSAAAQVALAPPMNTANNNKSTTDVQQQQKPAAPVYRGRPRGRPRGGGKGGGLSGRSERLGKIIGKVRGITVNLQKNTSVEPQESEANGPGRGNERRIGSRGWCEYTKKGNTSCVVKQATSFSKEFQPISKNHSGRSRQSGETEGRAAKHDGNGGLGDSPLYSPSVNGDNFADFLVPDYSLFLVPDFAGIYDEVAHMGVGCLSTEYIHERLRNLSDWYHLMKQVTMGQNRILAMEGIETVTKPDVETSIWYRDIFHELVNIETQVIAGLEREYSVLQSYADRDFHAEFRAIMRAADEDLWDATENAILHFIRTCRDMSVLRRTNDQTLFAHIRHTTGIDDISRVTFEDLVVAYEDQEGRDRSQYDHPQVKTRSNRGLHDRRVRRTDSSRLREKVGRAVEFVEDFEYEQMLSRIDSVSQDLEEAESDSQSVTSQANKLIQQRIGNISNLQKAAQSEAREHSMTEIYLWTGQSDLELVEDWAFDESNSAHIRRTLITPTQKAAAEALMSMLNGNDSKSGKSMFPKRTAKDDPIRDGSITTATSNFSPFYLVSSDEVALFNNTQRKRAWGGLGYRPQDFVAQIRERRAQHNSQSHKFAVEVRGGREIHDRRPEPLKNVDINNLANFNIDHKDRQDIYHQPDFSSDDSLYHTPILNKRALVDLKAGPKDTQAQTKKRKCNNTIATISESQQTPFGVSPINLSNLPVSPVVLASTYSSNRPPSPTVPVFPYRSYAHIAPFVPSTEAPVAGAEDYSDDIQNTLNSSQPPKYYIGGGKWSYAPF